MERRMFLLAVVVPFFLAAVDLFAQDEAPAPTYQQGDFWLFRVNEKDMVPQSTAALSGVYDVMFVEGQFRVGRPGREPFPGRQEIGELLAMLSNPSDAMQYLQFPLAVGKKWKANYQITFRGANRAMNRTGDNAVTGIETVATPAGRFRSFKIERQDTGGVGPPGMDPPRMASTYYYSPDARCVVKYHLEVLSQTGSNLGTRDIEVVKFGSKGAVKRPPQ